MSASPAPLTIDESCVDEEHLYTDDFDQPAQPEKNGHEKLQIEHCREINQNQDMGRYSDDHMDKEKQMGFRDFQINQKYDNTAAQIEIRENEIMKSKNHSNSSTGSEYHQSNQHQSEQENPQYQTHPLAEIRQEAKQFLNDYFLQKQLSQDLPDNRLGYDLPEGLEMRESQVGGAGMGVWTKCRLLSGHKFGPYEGRLKSTIENVSHAWEVGRNTFREIHQMAIIE
jgi:hypothetical protein